MFQIIQGVVLALFVVGALVSLWFVLNWVFKTTAGTAKKISTARNSHFPVIQDADTGEQVRPALQDSEKDGQPLSEREMLLIYEESKCPDCSGEIRWGPRGGMMQNVKCFGKCGARFNMSQSPMTMPLCDRQSDKVVV